MNTNINYKLAVNEWSNLEIEAAKDVLDSGYCTQGKVVDEYEELFATTVGSLDCISVNSGSSANLLMAEAMRSSSVCKKIVVPAIGWATSYAPFFQLGFEIHFCDVTPYSGNLCVEQLEKIFLEIRPSYALFISVLGSIDNCDIFLSLCEKYDVTPIGDFCEALNTHSLFKKQIQRFKYVSFSSYFSHHISTIEGGCLAVNSVSDAALARSIRSHGWDHDSRNKGNTVEERFTNKFKFINHGFNIRFNDVFAAIGIRQLENIQRANAKRNANFQEIKNIASEFPISMLASDIGEAPFSACLVCENNKVRNKMLAACEKFGIETRPLIAGCYLSQPIMEGFVSIFPVSTALDIEKKAFVVGLYGKQMRDEISILTKALEFGYVDSRG